MCNAKSKYSAAISDAFVVFSKKHKDPSVRGRGDDQLLCSNTSKAIATPTLGTFTQYPVL